MFYVTISAVMRCLQAAEEKQRRLGFLDPLSRRPAVPHGLRLSFRDWAAERTSYPRELAEMALAHTVGSDVERAYRRTDMIEKRREIMEGWQNFYQWQTFEARERDCPSVPIANRHCRPSRRNRHLTICHRVGPASRCAQAHACQLVNAHAMAAGIPPLPRFSLCRWHSLHVT